MRPLIVTTTIMGSLTLIAITICIYIILTPQGCESKACSHFQMVRVEIPGLGIVIGDVGTSLWEQHHIMQFKSIPYAESPTGTLRFQPPEPRAPWNEPHNGRQFGKRCPVITTVSQLSPEEREEDLEDCLNLSVYTKEVNDKKPVMFYVYGGGFYNGSSSDHPANMLLEKDVVLVVPQFRIGALGWLSTFTPELPGNMGIADILLALEWVKNHISAFGGDPDDITVFSQSAGAIVSSALLLSSHTPADAFQKLIVQSGSVFTDVGSNEDPIGQAERICKALGCEACDCKTAVHKCVMNVTVTQLLEVTTEESFTPIIGDYHGLLPMEPNLLVRTYDKNITLMAGFTKHDGSFILATYYDGLKKKYGNLTNISVRQFAKGLLNQLKDYSGLSDNLLTKMMFPADLLDTNDHKKAIPSYFDLCNTIFMKSPILTLARKMLSTKTAPVYFYTFDYEGNNTRFGYEFGNEHYPFEGGVHHSNDNIYLFNTHTLNEKDTKMAQQMVQLWSSFAIEGKPKPLDKNITIPPMKSAGGPYFHIDEKIQISDNILDEFTITIDDPDNYKFNREDVPF